MDIMVFFMKEIFKDIPGYKRAYQISNLGTVKSLERKIWMKQNNCFGVRKDRILKPGLGSSGYLKVNLHKKGKRKTINIHQLVAMAFLNHKPNGRKLVVNHINFTKTDNRVENLEVVTMRVNSNRKHLKSSSQYTGVHWNKEGKKWMAQIALNGKRKYLGLFTDELEASKAYQTALKNI